MAILTRWFACVVLLLCTTWSVATGVGVELTWYYTQDTIPAVLFRLERQTACTGDWGLVTVLGVATPTRVGENGEAIYTFVDASVEHGQSYCWRVVAVAATGKVSLPSNTTQMACEVHTPQHVTCKTWEGE